MLRIYEAPVMMTAEEALSKEELSNFAPSDCKPTSRILLMEVVMFIKGAPDVLLPRCSSVLLPTGVIAPLTPKLEESLIATQSQWSSSGQRVLLLARRIISGSEVDVKEFGSPEVVEDILRDHTKDLVVVGMIGIVDPPRADIPEVVRICRGAGIRFFMVNSPSILN